MRKFEYTENTSEYLNMMDTVLLLMNKYFQKEWKKWFENISKGGGLDDIGYYYLVQRLEQKDFPTSVSGIKKTILELFLTARFYDNSLKLRGSTEYVRKLKEYDQKELKERYGFLTDTLILRESKRAYLISMKANAHFLGLARKHCFPIVNNNRSCLKLKKDIVRSLWDRDFRVSYTKVNDMLKEVLEEM